jgi:hypothetical protein
VVCPLADALSTRPYDYILESQLTEESEIKGVLAVTLPQPILISPGSQHQAWR